MKYRKLGRTDISISSIGLGCYPFEGGMVWGDQDERDSIETIKAALDAGINFFDTAEAYGDGYSEELLGRVVAGQRDKVVIATKVSVSHLEPSQLRAACEGSLRRLGTDYIDLYQVHWPSRDVPLEDTIGALEELKSQGLVRAIGVSNFGVGDLTAFLEHGRTEANQLPYNLLWRAIEHNVVPKCLEHEIGVLTYSSLMQGLLTGKFESANDVPDGRARTRHFSTDRPLARHGGAGFEEETFTAITRLSKLAEENGLPLAQLAVAWLLHQPAVSSVLVGARNASQVRQNVPSAELEASPMVFNQMSSITQDLKEKLGPDPDMWQSNSRFN